ncbi:hypothetical protein L3Q82_017705 [Scortum barcoo]|uniref:Uncharacterized protein n=1 Tax=Scortum barcoo TaxID=214431 RepID=A0ACB8VLF6_9TELE|nr:hypothetical protein L3Q82_017705 [Scortum barcoo]
MVRRPSYLTLALKYIRPEAQLICQLLLLRFVEGLAKLAAPFHCLVAQLTATKSQKPSEASLPAAWTEECEQGFEGLKTRLVSASVLAYANFSLPFILEVDASYSGLGAVLSQEQEVLQLVLPTSLRKQVLQQLHNEHGAERTTELVRQWCYWPGMHHDIKQWCQECERCQVAKDTQPAACAYMGHLIASCPNQVLAIDFTILEHSRNGVEDILVMIDVFSKYTQAIPTMTSRHPQWPEYWLMSGFVGSGGPGRLHSDQGRNLRATSSSSSAICTAELRTVLWHGFYLFWAYFCPLLEEAERGTCPPFSINRTRVERVSSFRSLGVHISENLTWTHHTNFVTKSARQQLFLLHRLRRLNMDSSILCSFHRCTI